MNHPIETGPMCPNPPRVTTGRCAGALLAVGLAVSLGGCQTMKGWLAPAKPPAAPVPLAAVQAPPEQPAPAPPKPRKVIREVHAAKPPEKVASIDPNALVGLAPMGVEKMLGAPSKIEKSDLALVWTYSAAGCALRIFFYPDIKTALFHALKFGGINAGGVQIATTDACVRGILTVKASDAG